jgi:hypothetical protein
VKRPFATAALTGGALVAAGCGGGHLSVERHLVFVNLTQPTNATVWIADANGRRAHRLTRGYAAVVSPDGRTIAVGRPDGIHLFSSDGKRERRLTTANRWPEAWSSDGKWIIAATDYSLAVVDADSGRSHVVARGVVYGFGFSPMGAASSTHVRREPPVRTSAALGRTCMSAVSRAALVRE